MPDTIVDYVSKGHCYVGGQDSGWITSEGLLEWVKSL